MVPARESREGPPDGEAGALEPTSRKKKKKARVAVSIRKGNLLFFPTVLTDAAQEEDEPEEPELDRAKARESEED